VSICVYLWLICLSSCSSKPTDLRSLAPADSLIYLETNDLGAAIQPIIDSKAFNEAAKSKPDLSAIKGVQLAVAVTGFETTENKLNDENSELNFKPHFVAIADTHAWHFQAVGFAEQKLGSFVADIYGSDVSLEEPEKDGGRDMTWTAKDGRKAYAFVVGGVIYFGNDRSAIDKCLAVRRGEADSISKTGKVPDASNSLAIGYVSTDGIAQIANIVGVKLAASSGEESEVQTAISSLVPQLIRNSITEVTWTARNSEQGIEDDYSIKTSPEIADVLSETFVANGPAEPILFSHLADVPSATRYNLKDPQRAWASVLAIIQRQLDPQMGKIVKELSNALFEPYGVRDSEGFLGAVDSNILTANADTEGDSPFVVATFKDVEKLRRTIIDMKPPNGMTDEGISFWRAQDDDIEAVMNRNDIIIGSVPGVGGGFAGNGRIPATTPDESELKWLADSNAPITTIGRDDEAAVILAGLLATRRDGVAKIRSTCLTQTQFTKSGIERRTVSDFGLIGSIMASLAEEDQIPK
jgi:hypothetical protein